MMTKTKEKQFRKKVKEKEVLEEEIQEGRSEGEEGRKHRRGEEGKRREGKEWEGKEREGRRKIELGYPAPAAERAMLQNADSGTGQLAVQQRIDAAQLQQIRAAVDSVHTSDSLLDYLQRLAERSRQPGDFAVGLSPRGVLALARCARTWALMQDRDHVLPDDVQAVLPAVTAHRLQPGSGFSGDGMALVALLQREVDVV